MSDLHQLVQLDEHKRNRLYSLCLLAAAINQTCRSRNGVDYVSGNEVNEDESLGKFERFLCKLAFICDTRKSGGRTMTAMVCLKGDNGPEYLFASNSRNESELEITKNNLLGLLRFISENPDGIEEKPLHKQVLWRILELNFDRLSQYLKMLSRELADCVDELEHTKKQDVSQVAYRLTELRKDIDLPLDMTSTDNSKSRFLHRVEDFISKTQGMKEEGFQADLDRLSKETEGTGILCWRQLRHYLGRLQSYRQAADLMVKVSKEMPGLFMNVKVGYIPSGRQREISIGIGDKVDLPEVVAVALPSFPKDFFDADLRELEEYGLERQLIMEKSDRKMKTSVHGEVNLHHYLVSEGITTRHDYWNDTIFIATSKPLCKLCHFYFAHSDFRVQCSHMNLYPTWRLPDVYEEQSTETKEFVEERMQDVIEHLERDIRNTLEHKMSHYRRNDSRTHSYGISSHSRHIPSRLGPSDPARSRAATELMHGEVRKPSQEGAPPMSANGDDDSWASVNEETS